MTDLPPAQPDVARIIAHRGASGHAPENTLAGFQRAADMGCRWVEFDCMLTADEEIVLLHDEDLNRVAGVDRLIDDLDLAAVKALDVGSWFDPTFAGATVPTLAETFDLLGATGMGAIIEVKPSGRDRAKNGGVVAACVRDHWPRDLPPPVISSFSQAVIQAAADVAPEIARAIGFLTLPRDWRAIVDRLGCTAIHADQKHLTVQGVDAMIEAGFAVRAFTVNEADLAARLVGWGVESVFTDYPDRMKLV